jgi:uncharacterized membrane protein SpoIIM required for sporulation
MIIDVDRFVDSERHYWEELETTLDRLQNDPNRRMDIRHLKRFHYLYERASSDLARISTFAAEKEIRSYLESLVARAYGEIHESRNKPHKLRPIYWFFTHFPNVFREHVRAFALAVIITLVGSTFGAAVITFDYDSKQILMPFPHLQIKPSERVAMEEKSKEDRMEGVKTGFSAMLMTHNTRVSILTLAMGMTWGIGTIILLFYNGVILGSVCADYVLDGQSKFLMGWLMPHGVIEIPAILIAGQAGLVLAAALIGRGNRMPLRIRLREITGDLLTLIGGVAVLLIWAGIIEAFLSQYHQPVFPYWAKIGFGFVELLLLTLFLWRSGTGFFSPHSKLGEK